MTSSGQISVFCPLSKRVQHLCITKQTVVAYVQPSMPEAPGLLTSWEYKTNKPTLVKEPFPDFGRYQSMAHAK